MNTEKLYIDCEVFDLDFECHDCPSTLGVFSVRATRAEKDLLSPTCMPFFCPRMHRQTWTSYRGFFRVDNHGYTIDRRHPLWRDYMDPLTVEYIGRKSGVEL